MNEGKDTQKTNPIECCLPAEGGEKAEFGGMAQCPMVEMCQSMLKHSRMGLVLLIPGLFIRVGRDSDSPGAHRVGLAHGRHVHFTRPGHAHPGFFSPKAQYHSSACAKLPLTNNQDSFVADLITLNLHTKRNERQKECLSQSSDLR